MIIKLALRIVLTTLALVYAFPCLTGVRFTGDWLEAVLAAGVFNLAFFGLECLLTVVVVGINISTLGLGGLITGGLRFAASILSPAIALVGTAKILPGMFQVSVSHSYQALFVAGLVLGGVLWASGPEKKKSAT